MLVWGLWRAPGRHGELQNERLCEWGKMCSATYRYWHASGVLQFYCGAGVRMMIIREIEA